MNIVFYAGHKKWGGLANNGGSRTILRSANVLRLLGHRVDVVAKVDRFTWFDHKAPIHKIPSDTDVAIAVSVSDAQKLIGKSGSFSKAWWMRGWENWREDDEYIYKIAKRIPMITNGKGLSYKLAEKNIGSYLCYAGLDLDSWYHIPVRGEKIRIGCLYNLHHPTKRWDVFEEIVDRNGFKSYEYASFGTEDCHCNWLKKYLRNPSHEQLRELYSSCHIWIAPTDLEGFHNVPAEAALCGCHIICNNHPMNGMDYANEDTADIYETTGRAWQYIRMFKESKNKNMQKYLKENIGDRNTNMNNLIAILEKL